MVLKSSELYVPIQTTIKINNKINKFKRRIDFNVDKMNVEHEFEQQQQQQKLQQTNQYLSHYWLLLPSNVNIQYVCLCLSKY